MIKPMQFGINHLGKEAPNYFNYQDIGLAFDSARIFQGRGGTDTVHFEGINSNDVSFFNGSGEASMPHPILAINRFTAEQSLIP